VAKKIEVKSITYTRRFNLGNYEHEEYTAEAAVEGDAVAAFGELKDIIADAKGGDETGTSKSTSAEKKQVESASKKPGKAASKSSAKNKPSDDEDEDEDDDSVGEEDEEELEDAESDDDSEDEESDDSDSDDDEDEEEDPKPVAKKKAVAAAKKAVAKAEPKKKTFKSKASVYSRNSDLHKKLFVESVKEAMGADWLKKNAGRGKTVSIKLEGKEFIGADGQVLPSFKTELKKLAKAK
jgi:hypothetical protein